MVNIITVRDKFQDVRHGQSAMSLCYDNGCEILLQKRQKLE